MHVFLAGSTGVLGRRIIPLLIGDGHEVTALTRRSDRAGMLRSLGAHPAVADVFEPESLVAAVKRAAPDVVMHQLTDLASGTSASNAVLRTRGTRNLMDAARAAGVGRVISQSIAWAYSAGCEPAVEETPLDLGAAEPRLTTIRGVAALEQMTQEAPEWVVLRYGILYGPDTWYEPRGSKAADALAGRLLADADVTSFVHVDDAAAAAVQALAWPSGPVNICDDEPAAGREWVPAFYEAVGASTPAGSSSDARRPWARGADNHHARTHLAWSPCFPSWRQGFSRDTLRQPRFAGQPMTTSSGIGQPGTQATIVLRKYLEALTTGDQAAIADSFAEDATWSIHGTLPVSGTRHGRAAIMEFLISAGSLYQPGTQSFTFGQVTAEADRAVLEWRVRGTASATGREYDNAYCGVFRVRHGRIAEVREYLDSLHAAQVLFCDAT